MLRKVITIDEEKCDGCGLCVPACHEGAIQIVDGKARLVSEVYCDGLGDCLGECPQGAITMETREAEEFDAAAVEQHLARFEAQMAVTEAKQVVQSQHAFSGCPGSAARTIQREASVHMAVQDTAPAPLQSHLANWPVQIMLAPVQAPYFQGAKLLIAADCVPFSYADFHRKFVEGRTVIVGCPKLDDSELYIEKLTKLFQLNDLQSIEVPIMEVPCCSGLVHIVRSALAASEKKIPLTVSVIGVRGDLGETTELNV